MSDSKKQHDAALNERVDAVCQWMDNEGAGMARKLGETPGVAAVAVGSAWTQTPPAEQGTYWHWNGDEDCAPLPIFVLWSGFSRKCFVSRGQLGIEHAIDCDQYGGWWMPLKAPPLPNAGDVPRAGNGAAPKEKNTL